MQQCTEGSVWWLYQCTKGTVWWLHQCIKGTVRWLQRCTKGRVRWLQHFPGAADGWLQREDAARRRFWGGGRRKPNHQMWARFSIYFPSVNFFAINCDSLQLQLPKIKPKINISSVLIRYLDNQSSLSTQFESLGLVDEIGCPISPTLTKHSLGSLAPVSL